MAQATYYDRVNPTATRLFHDMLRVHRTASSASSVSNASSSATRSSSQFSLGNTRTFIEPRISIASSASATTSQSARSSFVQPDNISIRSAPVGGLSRSTSTHLCSSPPALTKQNRTGSSPIWSQQQPRQSRSSHKLANSASTSSILNCAGGLPSLMPRPKSYVPFHGYVETNAPPPGRAAHEILHALSFAPTHESFSEETQTLASEVDNETCRSPTRASWGPPGQSPKTSFRGQTSSRLPCIPQSPPRLRAKSSSFASLMCHQGGMEAVEDRVALSQSSNNFPQAVNLTPVQYVSSENEPIYAPTNPLNHPENSALRMCHPPVIYPPPDLVPASNFQQQQSSASTGRYMVATPPGVMMRRSHSGQLSGRVSSGGSSSSNISHSSPGLSSSASSGFETARSSSSLASSTISSVFDQGAVGGAGPGPGAGGQMVLESIREVSPFSPSPYSRT